MNAGLPGTHHVVAYGVAPSMSEPFSPTPIPNAGPFIWPPSTQLPTSPLDALQIAIKAGRLEAENEALAKERDALKVRVAELELQLERVREAAR